MPAWGTLAAGDFIVPPFLKAHPEFNWQAPVLRDIKAGPWTRFQAGERTP